MIADGHLHLDGFANDDRRRAIVFGRVGKEGIMVFFGHPNKKGFVAAPGRWFGVGFRVHGRAYTTVI